MDVKSFLLDGGARGDAEVVWIGGLDAGLNLKEGGGANHSGIIAGEARLREENWAICSLRRLEGL